MANVPYFWQICLGNELYPLLEALEHEKIRFILSLYIAYLKQSNLEVNMIRESMAIGNKPLSFLRAESYVSFSSS